MAEQAACSYSQSKNYSQQNYDGTSFVDTIWKNKKHAHILTSLENNFPNKVVTSTLLYENISKYAKDDKNLTRFM